MKTTKEERIVKLIRDFIRIAEGNVKLAATIYEQYKDKNPYQHAAKLSTDERTFFSNAVTEYFEEVNNDNNNDIQTLFNQLPYEAQQQIEDTLSDEGKTLDQVDVPFIKNEIEWTINRMQMDMEDGETDGEREHSVIAGCEKVLKIIDK
ncbi:hypothetical protein [Paenibacillus medicaginis]|uniref:Uncharacterized protein n=1 Tax=Paenibacillus medicaginis TaxID=1470560 RepID=A0ABV5BUW6_9BACL